MHHKNIFPTLSEDSIQSHKIKEDLIYMLVLAVRNTDTLLGELHKMLKLLLLKKTLTHETHQHADLEHNKECIVLY